VATIDYKDNFVLPDDEAHSNELRSLRYLACGLWFLYDQVQKVEAEVAKRVGDGKQVFIYGNDPQLEGIPQDLVACAFHWYAVSACNYVKMIGWLANAGDSNKAREYMECVLPQVYLWRHKVAAHFAIIDPRKDDNAADMAKSVMFPISFDDGAFYANSLTLTQSSGGKTSSSRQDMRWSLTHTHRNLILRYWPSKIDR
jgi:hypothetical protein